MITFLADENFNNDIIRGVRLRDPAVSIVRVQDIGLTEASDPVVLEWAAGNGRIVLTHDVSTMTRYAYERVERGERMPGVFEVPSDAAVGLIIENVLLIATCSLPDEWEGQVRYLPLR